VVGRCSHGEQGRGPAVESGPAGRRRPGRRRAPGDAAAAVGASSAPTRSAWGSGGVGGDGDGRRWHCGASVAGRSGSTGVQAAAARVERELGIEPPRSRKQGEWGEWLSARVWG
jgi:hypothetical protein